MTVVIGNPISEDEEGDGCGLCEDETTILMMEVIGEEEVDFSPDIPAQEPIAPGSSQQGDLPILDDPPGISQGPPLAPAQATSAASSDQQTRRSRSHPRLREEPRPQARLPREWRQAGPKEHAARRGGQLLPYNDPRRQK
eukprot:3640608-Pyramimonas_sp.AAC.1